MPPRGRVGPSEPRKTLSPPGRPQARGPPGDGVPGRGSGPPGPLPTRRGTRARTSSRPRVPSSSLALCLCRGGRRAGKCGPREKERTSGWRGELPVPRTGPQGPCEAGRICPGWGPLPRGRTFSVFQGVLIICSAFSQVVTVLWLQSTKQVHLSKPKPSMRRPTFCSRRSISNCLQCSRGRTVVS